MQFNIHIFVWDNVRNLKAILSAMHNASWDRWTLLGLEILSTEILHGNWNQCTVFWHFFSITFKIYMVIKDSCRADKPMILYTQSFFLHKVILFIIYYNHFYIIRLLTKFQNEGFSLIIYGPCLHSLVKSRLNFYKQFPCRR